MRRPVSLSWILTAAVAIVFSVAAAGEAAQEATVSATSANLRSGPGTQSSPSK